MRSCVEKGGVLGWTPTTTIPVITGKLARKSTRMLVDIKVQLKYGTYIDMLYLSKNKEPVHLIIEAKKLSTHRNKYSCQNPK